MRLDDKDRLLISILTREARLTNRELARRVGLSPSACLMRVRQLETKGVIVGYRAIVARSGAGRQIDAWADVRFLDPSSEATNAFIRLVAATPEITEAHRVSGPFDYALRFCAGDLNAWTTFRDRLASLGCEAQSRLSILTDPLK